MEYLHGPRLGHPRRVRYPVARHHYGRLPRKRNTPAHDCGRSTGRVERGERKEIRLFQRFSLLGFTRFGSPPAFSAQVCCKIGTSYRHLLLACASPECSPLGPAEHSHKAQSFSVTPSPQGVMPFHTEKLDDSVARDLLEFCFLPDPHTSASDLNGTISNRTTQKSCIACKRRAIA